MDLSASERHFSTVLCQLGSGLAQACEQRLSGCAQYGHLFVCSRLLNNAVHNTQTASAARELQNLITGLMSGLKPLEPQEVAVPSQEAVLVDYPGIVENPDAALASLGGPAAVGAALAKDSRATDLALRFRCCSAVGARLNCKAGLHDQLVPHAGLGTTLRTRYREVAHPRLACFCGSLGMQTMYQDFAPVCRHREEFFAL